MRALLIAVMILSAAGRGTAQQRVPDFKRQKQIQKALQEHGYKPGTSWTETQNILREIASEHHWQHVHAPDARVLILLGLGNEHSNPEILNADPIRLERKAKL